MILLLLGILMFCADKDMLTNESDRNVDSVTGPTPNGGDLVPAEEGPIRSAFGQPVFDLDTFKLTITGWIDSSYIIKWEDIQKLPTVTTDTLIMYCVEGWEVWGVWKGVLVQEFLDRISIYPDAEYLNFECVDGYQSVISISYAKKYNAMLAYEVNGKPLSDHDGFPLRLIAFGKFGYKWAKWVNKIEVYTIYDLIESVTGEWLDPGDVPIERRKWYEGEEAKELEY